jgi:hypothetical protein
LKKRTLGLKTVYVWALQRGCKKVSDTLSPKHRDFSQKISPYFFFSFHPFLGGAAPWADEAKKKLVQAAKK